MDWMGSDMKGMSHSRGVFVWVLLLCLLMSSCGQRVSAGEFREDEFAELQRSLARYRQLREFESSDLDLIEDSESKQATALERPTEFNSEQLKVDSENHVAGQESKRRKLLVSQMAGQESKRLTKLRRHAEADSDEDAELDLKSPEKPSDEIPDDEEEEPRVEGPKEEPFVFPEPYRFGPTIKDWDEQRSNWLDANPKMKSTLTKPRVLIVSGSPPGPCLSHVGDYFHMKSLKIKMDYARMHNYEFYYNFAWLDPLFGGWWVKLPTLRTLMLSHPEIEWFFWVDSDAVFTDMLFEPPFESYEGYNMVMWGWEYGLLTERSWVAFNAGVFLIRNCQWSLDLIEKWAPMGPRGPVRDEWGKIFTSFLSNRRGNFSSDDQSALAYLMITDEAVREKVKLVDSDVYMMSGFWIEVVDTYEDCAEKYHPGLGDKRWPWITHFTGCGFCAGGDNPAYSYSRCMATFERAYNFADNQVLALMGFRHDSISSENVTRTQNETSRAMQFVGLNPWKERVDQVTAAAAAELK